MAKGKKKSSAKSPTKKSPAKKTVAKKTVVKKAAVKKSAYKSTPKATAAKTSAKKATSKAAPKTSTKAPAKSLAKVSTKPAAKAVAKPAAKANAKTTAKASAKPASKVSAKATSKNSSSMPMKRAMAPAKKASTGNLDLSEFITPLDDRVLVLPKEKETMTAGGLYIPDTASEQGSYIEGLVVSVGRGHRSPKGHLRPMDVQLGDRILFSKFSGNDLKIQDYNLLILREADVLGVVS